jgi:3-oxoacyl-[acyl-carrier protein] reductase
MTPRKRRVLVTGGARGIGRAIALRMGREGHDVVLTWRSREREASQVVDAIRAAGGTGRSIRLDLTDQASIAGAGQLFEAEEGAIDVLVSNAGEIRDRLFLFQTDEDLRHVLDVNLTGSIRLTRIVLRGMLLRRFGRVVNIASVSGITGNVGQTNYSAAKGGMIAFTKSLAREVGTFGVTVNALAPGFISTEILEGLTEVRRAGALQAIPLRRFGRPEEVAGVVAWLASDEADWVTGATIRIDGGLAY